MAAALRPGPALASPQLRCSSTSSKLLPLPRRSIGNGTTAVFDLASRPRILDAGSGRGRLPCPHAYPPFMPPIISEIGDPEAHAIARQMRRVPVSVPSLGREPLYTAVVGPLGTTLEAAGSGPSDPVLVLLHSFDGSSLEWRRLYPRLVESAGLPVVAIDLVGWGFTDHAAWRRNPDLPVSPSLKREHLEAFRQQHLGGRPVVLAGISLGGTVAANYALAHPEAVRGLVLIDAQGFSAGVARLPRPLAVLGVWVLRQVWLRKMANRMAFFDKERFATDDAWRVGRLSTFLPGWLEANVAFIRSGGFDMSESRIRQLRGPVLLLWGESDEILPPSLATRWEATLGSERCKLVWVPRAGHSPHLEAPEVVATALAEFLKGLRCQGPDGSVPKQDVVGAPPHKPALVPDDAELPAIAATTGF